MKFGNGVGLGENELTPVGKTRFGLFGPGYGAFRGERGNAGGHSFFNGGGSRSHYAASFAATLTGLRKTMARLSLRRYFFAAARTSSRVTARNPSRMVFTSCGSPSNRGKTASRWMRPSRGL